MSFLLIGSSQLALFRSFVLILFMVLIFSFLIFEVIRLSFNYLVWTNYVARCMLRYQYNFCFLRYQTILIMCFLDFHHFYHQNTTLLNKCKYKKVRKRIWKRVIYTYKEIYIKTVVETRFHNIQMIRIQSHHQLHSFIHNYISQHIIYVSSNLQISTYSIRNKCTLSWVIQFNKINNILRSCMLLNEFQIFPIDPWH